MTNLQEAGQQAAAQIGIQWRVVPQDGRWHEVSAEGKDTRNGAGRIKLFPDGEGGMVCNWITGETFPFFVRSETTLDPTEREARRKHAAELRAKAEEERRKDAEAAAKKSGALWQAGTPATSNPYLQRKGVSSVSTVRQIDAARAAKIIGYTPKKHGEELTGDFLVVPIKIGFQLKACQLIDGEGRKHFPYGCELRGGHWSTGKPPEGDGTGETLAIAEGVATALTITEATGVTCFAAMSCGNLLHVATEMRRRYPAARLIICSDKGHGEEPARRAAEEVDALLAVPEIDGDGSDFNDIGNLDEVRRQVERAAKPTPWQGPTEDCPPRANVESVMGKETEEDEAPMLFDDLHVPEIDPFILPGWLGQFVAEVAASTQTPPAMAVMMALATVATCTARRFEVGPRAEGYAEPINLWTATALPPASRKTAVTTAITGPLSEWERDAAERLAPEIKRTEAKRRTLEKRIEKLERDTANAEDPASRAALLHEIEQIGAEIPEELRAPRLWTGDVTPEKLQSLLVDHGERMAVLSDEGGIFEVMGGLYNDGKANLDIFLQSHAGKDVRVDRQGRTAHLNSPALTFGLAVQPAVLQDMGQGSKKKFRGNGCLARFLYAIPRSNIGTRDVRAIRQVSPSVAARYRTGIFDLLAIVPQIQDGREITRRLSLTPGALDSWHAFAAMIEVAIGDGGELESIQDWAGKLPGAALRIAANFHLVEHGGNPPTQIEEDTIARALDLCQLLIDHAKAAFDMMAADPVAADAKAIFKWVVAEQLCRFTRTKVSRRFKSWNTNDTGRIGKALRELQSRHIVSAEIERTPGRSAEVFMVHSAIWGIS